MKNFPSSLIRQKNTKGGLGSNLGETLKNIGTQALSNIFGANKTNIDAINKKFEVGYERFDLEHEISNLTVNYNPRISETDNDEYNKLFNQYNSQINLEPNEDNGSNTQATEKIRFEDPFLFSSTIFSTINNYKYVLKTSVPSLLEKMAFKDKKEAEKPDYQGEKGIVLMHSITSPSLFNPFATVNISGIVENVPLIDDSINSGVTVDASFSNNTYGENENGPKLFKTEAEKTIKLAETIDNAQLGHNKDISDCSIKTLVELSNKKDLNSRDQELGLATYRYVDFMFCKDLGKFPNNHLITLRRFPGPIGDNIFFDAHPLNKNNVKNSNDASERFKSYPDLGRLVTWFGNEDNKLEDICRYNYKASWKEFHAELKVQDSQDKDDGMLSKLANTFSPQNNTLVSKGFSGNTGLLGWGAQKLHIPILSDARAQSPYYGLETLGNYDQHRIYEPPNRIWDTHKYEGKLEFNQEITLTFRYVLRSYANINPKSAFLDLLANIQIVTYRRGSFWGGENKVVGPQGNSNIYNRGNAFIDKAFDKLGGIWNNLKNGDVDLNALQGWLSNVMESVGETFAKAADTASGILGIDKSAGGNEKRKEFMEKIENLNSKYHFTDAIKGMIKNQLGRPSIYAFNSLLTGEDVGPWHLTIGNPRNPIMSIGNLIIDSPVEFQHSGPLGLDDFPTEIKVTVTLKHGRPRDSVEIQKMYTKGNSAIYRPMNLMELSKYDNNSTAFGDIISIYNDKKTLSKLLRSI